MYQYCELVSKFNSIPHKPVLRHVTHSRLVTGTNIIKGHLMKRLGAPSVPESAKPETFHGFNPLLMKLVLLLSETSKANPNQQ